jgi:hypothetical protein
MTLCSLCDVPIFKFLGWIFQLYKLGWIRVWARCTQSGSDWPVLHHRGMPLIDRPLGSLDRLWQTALKKRRVLDWQIKRQGRRFIAV